ncbi:MBL fold metallo-hydrolase [Lichenicoccus sp.]|uniref:MBL fold metallo-hydrolase n=1 Tax=Lichenicoccus sp. TaxID=2781899 RepID=UPI003D130B75
MTDLSHHTADGFCNPPWLSPPEPAPDPAIAAPHGSRSRMLTLLRWRMRRSGSPWPTWITDPPPSGDPFAVPSPGQVSVTFIGHSCFLIRLPGLTVLTDPMFSHRASPVSWIGPARVRAPGRRLDELPPVDLVLQSHNHYDHLDLPSLRALYRRSAPRVITPLGNAGLIRKAGRFSVEELDWWQTSQGWQTGQTDHPVPVRITAVPARHFSARTTRDTGRALWAGFMLETMPRQEAPHGAGLRILFAGDTGDGTHWPLIRDRLGAPDLALLPIGAYAPRAIMRRMHMDPAEAVRAHRQLGAKQSIGMHFGTFRLTDEAVDAPELALAVERDRQHVDPAAFVTLGFGECRSFLFPPT